jgi:hypothetical protein
MVKRQHNTNTIALSLVAPLTDREAFLSKQQEIAAITDDELVPINVEVPYAAAIVLGVAPRIETLLPGLQTLPDYDLGPVLEVRTYAAAAVYAHLQAMGTPITDPTLPAKQAEAVPLREGMLRSAETLAFYGMLPERRVAAIRAGTGWFDTGSDLSSLSALYLEFWATVEKHTAVTMAQVERAGVLGLELQTHFGIKRAESESGQPSELQMIRARAFTKLVKVWSHVRRGVQFLRWEQGDADSFAPSIYLKRRRKGSSAVAIEDEGPTQPEVVPIPDLPVDPAPAPVNA